MRINPKVLAAIVTIGSSIFGLADGILMISESKKKNEHDDNDKTEKSAETDSNESQQDD